MATERLEIRNFKGIKRLELEIKPFTVLTGPQSVGKSTVAKLLYYFKKLPQKVRSAAIISAATTRKGDARPESLSSELNEEFSRLFPQPRQAQGRSEIRYSSGENSFLLTGKAGDEHWVLKTPDSYAETFSETVKTIAAARDVIEEVASMAFAKTDIALFIPAGRAFCAQIERDPVSFFGSASLDPTIADFGKFYARVRNFPTPRRPGPGLGQEARTLIDQLLGGRYCRENERDYIELTDGQRLPADSWSSGQQESLPLALILEKCAIQDHPLREVGTLLIEEPEAHLYPTFQRVITHLLALAFNARGGGTAFFLTTHSPYVLSALNMLLTAGQLTKQSNGKRKAAAKIVSPSLAVPANMLGAYYMDHSHCESMIDRETGLIAGRGIDDVSEDIAEEFEALIALQLS